jgi:glycine/D-amino acid oxidase-like deaminating enzyme
MKEPHRSLWLEQAYTGSTDAPVLTGGDRADVAIIGGGYLGLWTAILLKEREPDLDVVIVERDVCGGGASGRNGGWVNGWQDALPSLVGLFGAERARWLLEQSVASVDEIARTIPGMFERGAACTSPWGRACSIIAFSSCPMAGLW